MSPKICKHNVPFYSSCAECQRILHDPLLATHDDNQDWQSLIASEDYQKSFIKRSNFPNGESNSMINVQRNNIPQDNGAAVRGVTFLSPRHVSDEGVKAVIEKVTTNKPDNFGNPVVVYFNIGGTKYSKGFKLTSHLLISLCDLLGEDETKWMKKTVIVKRVYSDDNQAQLHFSK